MSVGGTKSMEDAERWLADIALELKKIRGILEVYLDVVVTNGEEVK